AQMREWPTPCPRQASPRVGPPSLVLSKMVQGPTPVGQLLATEDIDGTEILFQKDRGQFRQIFLKDRPYPIVRKVLCRKIVHPVFIIDKKVERIAQGIDHIGSLLVTGHIR